MKDTLLQQIADLRKEVRGDVRVLHKKLDAMSADFRKEVEKYGSIASNELEKHEDKCVQSAKYHMRIIVVLVLLVISDHEKVGDLISIILRAL